MYSRDGYSGLKSRYENDDHDASLYTDTDRREFLNALDASPISVTGWESGFINDTLTRKYFSPGQRKSIDSMIEKYGNKIRW